MIANHDKSIKSTRKNEELSILVNKTLKATSRRKQKHPQRWQEEKKVSSEGREKVNKKINKKGDGPGRSIKKDLKTNKIVSNVKAQIKKAALPRKIELAAAEDSISTEDFGEVEKFEKVLENFEKKLNFIHDIETLRLVWFLVYIIIKEKRERATERAKLV